MKRTMLKNVFYRVISILLAAIMVLAAMAPATAVDSGGHAVSVELAAENGTVFNMGNSGTLTLRIGVNSPNQNGTADIRINIDDDNVILPDFENGSSMQLGDQVITLETDISTGKRYLQILGVPNGATRSAPLRFQYTNGITGPTTLSIDDQDIEVTLNDIEGTRIIEKGDSLTFISTFYWSPVLKTESSGTITVNGNHWLEGGNVTYRINASSYNHSGSADIHTKEYTLTDTLTLPEGLTFPEGEFRMDYNQEAALAIIYKGGIKIAEFSRSSTEDSVGVSDLRLSDTTDNSFKLIFTCTRPEGDDGTKELYNPSITATVYTAPLVVADSLLQGSSPRIINHVDFEAIPLITPYNVSELNSTTHELEIDPANTSSDSHKSSSQVFTPIIVPEPAYDLTKDLFAFEIDPETGITTLIYSLSVRNTGITPITLDVTDTLPAGMSLTDGQAFLGSVIGTGSTITGVTGTTDNGRQTVTWGSVNIPVNGTFISSLQAQIPANSQAGSYVNTLSATLTGTDQTKEQTHTYEYEAPRTDFILDKSHKVHSGQDNTTIFEGGRVTYTIEIESTGDMRLDLSGMSDVCPDTMEIDTTSFTMNGEPVDEGGITVTQGEGNQTIQFPLPEGGLRKGETVIYTYEATLKNESGLQAGDHIVNTVTAETNAGNASDTDTLTVRDRTTNLSAEKKKGKAVFVGGNTYAIDYSIQVTNLGDAMSAGAVIELTDTMEGALYIDPSSFTIAFTNSNGTASTIVPRVEPFTEADGGTGYRIKWDLSDMPAYEIGGDAPAFTYTYTAYVDIQEGETVNIKNGLLVGGSSAGVAVPDEEALTPAPRAAKVITWTTCSSTRSQSHTISGQNYSKARYAHSGDTIGYRMTFTNTGTLEMIHSLITDTLPIGLIYNGAGYEWKLKGSVSDQANGYIDSISISSTGFGGNMTFGYALKHLGTAGTQLVISYSAEDAANGSPRGFTFPVGATITLDVRLRFPSGETYNNHFLTYNNTTQSFSEPANPFVNRVTLTGADRGGNTFSVSDHADVRAQPNNMNIAKEADRDTLKAGETVTFTFKGGYTGNLQYFTQNGAATDVTLVEDLTPFKDSFELVAYNPGRFDGYKGYSLNGNTLNRTKGSYTVTIPGSAPLSRALDTEARMVTLAEPIDLSALSGDELKVTWDFGDVSDLWVSNAGDLKDNWPSVTLRAKEDIHTQSFTNVATLSYDRIRTAHGKADIIIIAGGRLGKSATRDSADGGIVDGTINNGNIHERLQVGDIVTFTLEYANTSTVPEVYTAEEPLTLIDIMTTNGLAVYSSDVVFKHIHAEEGAGDNAVLLSPHVMEVTAEGIVSASAKRTEFKISGTLQPSDVIRIRYQVKIGEGFMNSVSDLLNRQDEYQNGLLNPETAGGNLSQVHNYVYTTDASGTRHYDETPYYYTPAGNRLYFSKAVKDIGHITAMPNSGGHDYLTINPNDYTTQLHQLGSSEQNFIKYVLVIHNDANSGENLVINSITDVLPPRVQPITDNTGGQQFILLNFLAYNNGIDSNYSRSSYIGPANASTIYTAGHLEQMLLASPIANAGYRAVPACVNITSQSYASVTFQMRDTKNSAALVLKPGEYTAICYGVCIDRTADTSNYTNQATLDVQPASDGGGWQSAGESLQSVFVARQKGQTAAPANVSTGTPVNQEGTEFRAGVTIATPVYRMRMSKTASSYFRVEDKSKLKDPEFLRSFLDERVEDAGIAMTGLTNWAEYGLYDIVEWKLTVTNDSTVAVDDFLLRDIIPYPHRVVSYRIDEQEFICIVDDEDHDTPWVYSGYVEDKNLPHGITSLGQTNQEATGAPFHLRPKETVMVYIYTYYDPDAPVTYSSTTNRAQVTSQGGKIFNNITGSNPILNSSGQIIGATQSATVNPAYSALVSSYKSVSFTDESGTQTAFGYNEGMDRVVTAGGRGDMVRYTLSIHNEDDKNDMRKLTIIDNLPVPGDYGVVNLASERESAFTINLADNPDIRVEIKGINDGGETWTPLRQSDAAVSGLEDMQADEYLILYTNHPRHEGADPSLVWHFDTPDAGNHWFTDPHDMDPRYGSRVTSVLFYIPTAVKANMELRISFDCAIQDDAWKGIIAWNSFGYRYQQVVTASEPDENAALVYAEPAKVGVTIGGPAYSLPVVGGAGINPYLRAGSALLILGTLFMVFRVCRKRRRRYI